MKGLESKVGQEMEELQSLERVDGSAVPIAGDSSTVGGLAAAEENKLPAHTLSMLEGLGSGLGRMPGSQSIYTDKQAYTEGDRDELLAQTTAFEGSEGLAGQVELRTMVSKYPVPKLSKFEEDALGRTLNRQRDRIEYGVPQVRSLHQLLLKWGGLPHWVLFFM